MTTVDSAEIVAFALARPAATAGLSSVQDEPEPTCRAPRPCGSATIAGGLVPAPAAEGRSPGVRGGVGPVVSSSD